MAVSDFWCGVGHGTTGTSVQPLGRRCMRLGMVFAAPVHLAVPCPRACARAMRVFQKDNIKNLKNLDKNLVSLFLSPRVVSRNGNAVIARMFLPFFYFGRSPLRCRCTPEQKEIYYLCAPNRDLAEASPYYEAFRASGREVRAAACRASSANGMMVVPAVGDSCMCCFALL